MGRGAVSTGQITIFPDEAAALDRLLSAYTVTEEGDPGAVALVRFLRRLATVPQDHSVYEAALAPAAHVGRIEPASRRGGRRGEFIRAVCSCGGFTGPKVKFRHTAQRHLDQHLAQVAQDPAKELIG